MAETCAHFFPPSHLSQTFLNHGQYATKHSYHGPVLIIVPLRSPVQSTRKIGLKKSNHCQNMRSFPPSISPFPKLPDSGPTARCVSGRAESPSYPLSPSVAFFGLPKRRRLSDLVLPERKEESCSSGWPRHDGEGSLRGGGKGKLQAKTVKSKFRNQASVLKIG